MGNTHDDVDLGDGISVPSMGILPGVEERFSFKNLLFPNNPEPSTLSGFAVNTCASLMGRWSYIQWIHLKYINWVLRVKLNGTYAELYMKWYTNICTFAGTLILVFSIMAVQGGAAVWNIIALSVIFMVCLLLTIIIWRQPESKTKLSFKVWFQKLSLCRFCIYFNTLYVCLTQIAMSPFYIWLLRFHCYPLFQWSACL